MSGGQGLTALPGTVGRGALSAPFLNKENLPIPAGQRQAAGQQSQGQDHGEYSEDVLKAFVKDTGPAADAIKELLKNPSKEAAEALMKNLPSLMPDDPALAAVIAEEMAKEFKAKGEPTANKQERVPGGNGNGGQFTGATNQPRPREHADKGFQDNYGTTNEETLLSDPKRNVERGKAVFTHLIGKKEGSEPKAMFRKDVGWIGVDYGAPGNPDNEYAGGHGIAHIVSKHEGAIDGIVDVLQTGTAYKHDKSERKVFIIKDRTAVVLSKNRDGRLLITDFEKISDKQFKDFTSRGVYHAKGEN